MVQTSLAVLALAIFSQHALALPDRREAQVTTAPVIPKYSCYTYTATVTDTRPIPCPYITCGPHPDCVLLKQVTLTVPCKNPKCFPTPTVTITKPRACPTCQTGCLTETETTTTTKCPSYTVL